MMVGHGWMGGWVVRVVCWRCAEGDIFQNRREFEMLYKSKSNHSLLKGKQLSLLHLTTLSNFLESEQGVTQDITKEIKNEVALSRKNGRVIEKSMAKINDRAEELVRRFEEEKEKHEKLTFLVAHIEAEIYSAKLDKSLEVRPDSDQLEELTGQLRARERELEKVCEKTNSSSYELSRKLDSIRALRSERTIVSELLDKIERELCNLEHCYKVLVIERTIEDHLCQEKLEDFRRMEQSARKEITRALNAARDQKDQEEDFKLVVHPSSNEQANQQPLAATSGSLRPSLIAVDEGSARVASHSEAGKEKDRARERKAKAESDILRLEREKTVKIILNNLGISSPKELPDSLEALSAGNDATLRLLSRLEEEIESKQQAISQLATRKRTRQTTRKTRKDPIRDHRLSIREVSEQVRQAKLQSSEFRAIARILYSRICECGGEQASVDFYNEEQQIRFYMGFLESFLEKSYVEGRRVRECAKDGNASKRLTSLLNSHMLDRNHMSIYEEQDLLDFAKKNLERIDRKPERS